jgi:parvulin-like peptidyl-prolyl isomerase
MSRPFFYRQVPVLAALLALGAAPFGVACNGKKPTAETTDAAKSSEAVTPEQAKMVLAKAGDVTITVGDFAELLQAMDEFDRLRYQSPERRKELLDELINVELLAQEAVRKGYDKSPEAQAELHGILRDAYLGTVRKDAVKPQDVPETEARDYFAKHKEDYKDPERRRVSVIYVRDPKVAEQVQAKAKEAKDAASWGKLVIEKSQDPGAKLPVPVDLVGDLGIVSPPGDPRGENARVPEAVRTELFALKQLGDISEKPVKVAPDKFYIVRYTQKTEAHERTYEEAERTIRVKLAQEKARAREREVLETLSKKYAIVIDEAVLASVKIDAPGPAPSTSASAAPAPDTAPKPVHEHTH